MKGRPRLLIALPVIVVMVAAACWMLVQGQDSATKPTSRWEPRWLNRHRSLCEQAITGSYKVVFVGDSITQNWETEGQAIWKRYYGNRNALNLGISADRTQHVLWRIQKTEWSDAAPQLVVLLVGTNNSADNSGAETAEGIQLIVTTLREKLPEAKILLTGIFPRGVDIDDPRRQVNEAVNELIANLADNEVVFFIDIGSNWLNPDGSTNLDLMPDALHLNEAGYAAWAAAIEPTISSLLDE